MKKWALITFALFSFIYISHGQAELSGEIDRALFEILNLRTNTGQRIIDAEKEARGVTVYDEYLENWKEVIELICYTDDERYDAYLESLDRRLKRIEETQDPTLAGYHIYLGEIYCHAAMANIMYGDFLPGFRRLLNGNRNARESVKDHPGFWRNDKLVGIMNVSFDKIPGILKWLTTLFGLKGDAELGYRQMDQYLETVKEYPGLKSEYLLYYVLAFRLSKYDQYADEFLKRNIDPENSPRLTLFLQATISLGAGKNEEGLNAIASYADVQPEVPFEFDPFLRGKLKLNRLDPDADKDLLRFLEHSSFKNYKRDISMKLAYHYYMQGQEEQYRHYKTLIGTFEKSTTDRDREADSENEKPYDPHPEILKARFLIDGSYFQRAGAILSGIKPVSLDRAAYLSEYYLLEGQWRASEGAYQAALESYEKAIEIGRDLKELYAAKAALYAGLSAQKEGQGTMANYYWRMALEIDGPKDIYIENIHIKAKNHLKETEVQKDSLAAIDE